MNQRVIRIKRNYSVSTGIFMTVANPSSLSFLEIVKVYTNKGFIIFKLQTKLHWWSHSVKVLYDYINIRSVMIINYHNNVNISEIT